MSRTYSDDGTASEDNSGTEDNSNDGHGSNMDHNTVTLLRRCIILEKQED